MKKIPDHAKKVLDGVIFSVYHWDQEMYDGSTQIFEAIKKQDSVTVLATYEGKIVINEEEQPDRLPFISLPGGRCEPECSTLENAKRELLEETGLASTDWQMWFISDPIKHHKIEWNNYVFIARNCRIAGDKKLDVGEKIVNKFITFDEFLELRNDDRSRNEDMKVVLQRAYSNEDEKRKLRELLGIIN